MLTDTEKIVSVEEMKTFIMHSFADVDVITEKPDYFRVVWRVPKSGIYFECLVTVDEVDAALAHVRSNSVTEELAFTKTVRIDCLASDFYQRFHAELTRKYLPQHFGESE